MNHVIRDVMNLNQVSEARLKGLTIKLKVPVALPRDLKSYGLKATYAERQIKTKQNFS